MVYLESFTFATEDNEVDFRWALKRTCYDTIYPFGILTNHSFKRIEFEPVTILYGGNGCGKTTALNVIAEKLQITRDSAFNKSNFFADYVRYCSFETKKKNPDESRIITSDDVFDFMLNLRAINERCKNI